MKRISVKFINAYPPYLKNDTASFFEREANRLIDRGFAIYAGGDQKRETAADRLKNLHNPDTKHISGPTQTRHIPGPDETKNQPQNGGNMLNGTNGNLAGNRPSPVEGSGKKGASGKGKGRGKSKK